MVYANLTETFLPSADGHFKMLIYYIVLLLYCLENADLNCM